MKNSSDFEKYLKSKKIGSSYQKHYTSICGQMMDDPMMNMYSPTDVFQRLLKERILILGGEMDDNLCEMLKANLLYLESLDPDKDIKIYCNSPGGSVYSGLGLLDIMDYIKPEICTINTGLAASMAAIILCSGTKGKRKALKRSRTMIHQPISYIGFAQASDIEIDSREILSLKKELYEIVSDRTGQVYDKVHKDSDRDYWMNSEEAKRYGMIDEIIIKRK